MKSDVLFQETATSRWCSRTETGRVSGVVDSRSAAKMELGKRAAKIRAV